MFGEKLGSEMNILVLEEKVCCECGEPFVPAHGELIEELEEGTEVYCHCPNHSRYTMGHVVRVRTA